MKHARVLINGLEERFFSDDSDPDGYRLQTPDGRIFSGRNPAGFKAGMFFRYQDLIR